MIELFIVLSTMCPASYAGDHCYEKQEIVRKGDTFTVQSSTIVPQCEIEGHRWIKKQLSNLCMGDCSYWVCHICGVSRKMKTIKREVEEAVPDDGPADREEISEIRMIGL